MTKGYWRPSNMSDKIEKCINAEINCLGGKENFQCFEGHSGALCESCDLYKKHHNFSYSRSGFSQILIFNCNKIYIKVQPLVGRVLK